MYYHARPMKYVKYGKVSGNPEPDEFLGAAYKWLSNYCGYFPQVWLARSNSMMTGIRTPWKKEVDVLFGFDVIKGFPVHYHWWCFMIMYILDKSLAEFDPVTDKERYNKVIWKEIETLWARSSNRPQLGPKSPFSYSSMEEWLDKEVFVKHDQVVVPSLNLKAAKEVFCKSDRDKKKLRKMGFIEDRIKVRKFPSPWG